MKYNRNKVFILQLGPKKQLYKKRVGVIKSICMYKNDGIFTSIVKKIYLVFLSPVSLALSHKNEIVC